MDPAQPAALPPLPQGNPAPTPAYSPAGGGYTALPARAPAPTNPVGRPSSDPAAQEARAARSRDETRLEGLSPARAKDHKLCVSRTDPATGRARGKPVLTLLSSVIEDVVSKAGDRADDALDEFITSSMPDKAPDGIYKCQWFDRSNHPVANPPPWELQVGDVDGSIDELEEIEDDVDDAPGFEMPTMPVNTSFAPPAPAPLPPAPPAMDNIAAVGSALRAERQEEGKRSNETLTLIVSMQQQSQQQMNMMMQLQQQQQQAAQALAAQAEERDRARRGEFRQTLMTMLPLVLPMIQQWFMPKDKGASAEMTMLLELVKSSMTNKGSDAVMFENMMKLNGEMTRQAMELQRSGAATSSEMQAQATGLVFKNLMDTLKETMAMKTQVPEKEEESTLGSIAKIAGPIIAAVQQQQAAAQQQQQQAPPEPAHPAVAAPAQPRRVSVKPAPPADAAQPNPPAAPAAEQQPRRKAQRPEKPKADPTKYSDPKRVEGVLLLVRKLSLGIIKPTDRWHAIRWMAEWMPPTMLEAVKAKNEAKVLEQGMGVALSNATILGWITDEENQGFLRDALEDVRKLITGEITESLAEASVIKSGQFVQRRLQANGAREAADAAALAKHTNPEEAPVTKPPVSASLATDATAHVAPPTDAAIAPPPTSGKIPPPQAN